ncbi:MULTISPECIES: hypothetical protein [unclassified Paenibacillus]|uniref:hypothetical protein n=1 Tax=unclassified Paenibacillus TaxID=185978 RepID=UPI000953C386|nr:MULTISPECIES: hypothetical protein [unclassified Paenibacillus]ASS66421.1 hypothetical protein CIC07_09835 [Paenibacillus sp. RUD330]SIQ04884.1 hypothetical protein SAMN05880555_0451 [Paenibacillus sp. RU4X]SIQ25009.1 hypothetical protein SAMN05880570_0451 [Paenibacillus sp. RU4T]
MNSIMIFLHVLGAGGVGFYLILPFLVGRASRLAGAGQQGLAEGLIAGNRIAQYFLILQFLTGGYLISQADYTVLWMVGVIVLFLAIAALGGIQTKPLKRIVSQIQAGQSATAEIGKVRMFSFILLVLYIVTLYLMVNPFYK